MVGYIIEPVVYGVWGWKVFNFSTGELIDCDITNDIREAILSVISYLRLYNVDYSFKELSDNVVKELYYKELERGYINNN